MEAAPWTQEPVRRLLHLQQSPLPPPCPHPVPVAAMEEQVREARVPFFSAGTGGTTMAASGGSGGGGGGGLARSASSPCLSGRNHGRGRQSRSFHRDLNALGTGGGGGVGGGGKAGSPGNAVQHPKRRAEDERWEAYEEEEEEEGRLRRACAAAAAAAAPGSTSTIIRTLQSASTTSTGSSTSSTSMDQSLPTDVLELCLVRLPWRVLVRMRLVCKRWRALLLSPSFLRLRAATGHHEPWMYIFRPESATTGQPAAVVAYDPVFHKSHELRAPPALAGRAHYSLAAAGGLVYLVGGGGCGTGGTGGGCTGDRDRDDNEPPPALVYNPVTGAWRKLPAMHHARDSPAVGVLLPGGGAAPKLVVAGGKGLSRRSLCSAELYDPATNRWSYITSLPPPLADARHGAVHNGKLLVYTRRLNLTNEVASYDPDRGAWTRLPVTHSPGAPPPRYHHFHLASCAGALVKVEDGPHMNSKDDGDGDGAGAGPGGRAISVWRLDEPRMEWREVAKIPPLDKGTWLWYIGCVAGGEGGRQCLVYLYEVKYPDLVSIRCCVCDLRTGKAHWQWVTDMPYMVHPNDLTAIVQL